jgi:hypothetical protein
VTLLTSYPLWALVLRVFQTKLAQTFAPHLRPHQGEQVWCWPPWLTLPALLRIRLTSGNFEIERRSYPFCDFTKLHHFAPHHHLYASTIIWSHSTKIHWKIWKFVSCGHFTEHLGCTILPTTYTQKPSSLLP